MKNTKAMKRSRIIRSSYLGELLSILKEGGLKLFLHYQGLVLREILGFKTFKVNSFNICTTNETITVGEEYQYKEGCHLKRVVIEKIFFRKFFIHVNVFFLDDKRSVKLCHSLRPIGYSGMWRIYDKDHYDYNDWYTDICGPIDEGFLENLPVITIP